MLILGIKVKCYFFYYILVKWSSCRPKDKVILSFTVMLEERMQGYEGLHVSCRSLHLHLWADQYQQSFTWLPFKPVQFDLKKKKKKSWYLRKRPQICCLTVSTFVLVTLCEFYTHSRRPTTIPSDVTVQAEASAVSNGVTCCWDVGGKEWRVQRKWRKDCYRDVKDMFVFLNSFSILHEE